jgi:hypothetical protein
MPQVPGARNVAVLPDTAQTAGVEEPKVTANAELAVADNASGVPRVCATGATNTMVCDCSGT